MSKIKLRESADPIKQPEKPKWKICKFGDNTKCCKTCGDSIKRIGDTDCSDCFQPQRMKCWYK